MSRKALAHDSYQYIGGAAKESHTGSGRLMGFLQSSLLADTLSCWLLSAGLSLAALALTDFGGGFWSYFGLACLSTLAVAIFSRRWWLAPAAVAASASAGALYLGLTGRLESASVYWAGFFAWISHGLPYDEIYSEDGGTAVVKAAIIFLIVLVCFIAIRRLFSLPVIFLLTGMFFGAVYYLSRDDLSVSLCVSAAGMVILLPRMYSRYVSLRSGSTDNRGAMQVVAVPAAFLAMLLALWFIPQDTSTWKSRGLVNFIADIAYMFEGPFSLYPPNASNFSMKRLGFERENGHLGGPVQLTDEKYLSVSTDRPMLLRGAVMDLYTGEGWRVGAADGDFRYDSLFWQGYKRSAFGLGKPLGNEAKKLFEELTTERELNISYHSDQFCTLFAGGMLRDADFAKNTIVEPIYFNARSELYLHYRIPWMTKLQVETRVWNTGLAGFEQSFLRLEQLAANRGDKNYGQIKARYTNLPDTLPESVAELALKITAESESPYQKARAIEMWLSENCEYTLDPAIPPEDADFVGHFLDTREGYCTYYASAMAVLARAVGLPSRYVTGFALKQDLGNASLFFATGETAHAWAEIYFDGIGWIEFDPLDWNPEAPLNQEQADLRNPQEQPAFTPPQVPANNPATDESTDQDIPSRNAVSSQQVLSFVAVIVAVYIIAHLAVIWIMRGKFRVYEFSRVSRKIPDLASQINFYFDDVFKQLSLLGIAVYTGETLTEFSARVDRRLKLEDKNFAAVAETRMRMHFSEAAPSIEDCKAISQYHHELELLLRERLSKTAYFFKRALKR